MQSKKDIKLKGILTGRWGQFMDSRKTRVHLCLGLVLLVLPALPAWASSDVTAANYSSNAAGDVVITLSTGGDDPNVSVFATESPARIILDLADTNSQVDASPVSVGVGAVQKFTTLAAGGRTRVMVDLSRLVTYDYQSGNGQVVLSISGNGEGPQHQVIAEPQNTRLRILISGVVKMAKVRLSSAWIRTVQIFR